MKEKFPDRGCRTVPLVAVGLGEHPVHCGLIQQHVDPAEQLGMAALPVGRVTHVWHHGCSQHSAAQSEAALAAETSAAR